MLGTLQRALMMPNLSMKPALIKSILVAKNAAPVFKQTTN